MTPAEKKASELASDHAKDLWKLGNGNTAYFSFLAGFRAALELAEVKGLENTLEFCLKNFLDIPCDKESHKGVLTTGRIEANKALTAWRSFRGEK